jgi:hypothetical protein
MISTRTTVSTTAAKLISAAINETRLVIVRPDGNDLYLGGSNVTTSNGLKLDNNASLTIQIPPNEELWAVTGSGTHAAVVLTWAVETL